MQKHDIADSSIGCVIVGTGLIAKFHASAVVSSDKLHLIGVCGRSKEKACAFIAAIDDEETRNACAAFDDIDAALSIPGVGLCIVGTASGAHDEAVFAAARHGVPVLVEKPLALTIARTDAMIEVCEKANVPLGCIFQTRWTEQFAKLREAVESGRLGKITYASVQVPWWRDDRYYTESSWHGTKEMDGGGALINQAIHTVDWLAALMPPVKDVKAFTATLAHPMEAEDTVSAAVLFEGGALGHVYATTASYPGRGKRIEITGTEGTIVVEDEAHGTNRPDAIPFEPHKKAIESFVDSINGGVPYPIDGREARKSIALVESIYNSALR